MPVLGASCSVHQNFLRSYLLFPLGNIKVDGRDGWGNEGKRKEFWGRAEGTRLMADVSLWKSRLELGRKERMRSNVLKYERSSHNASGYTILRLADLGNQVGVLLESWDGRGTATEFSVLYPEWRLSVICCCSCPTHNRAVKHMYREQCLVLSGERLLTWVVSAVVWAPAELECELKGLQYKCYRHIYLRHMVTELLFFLILEATLKGVCL